MSSAWINVNKRLLEGSSLINAIPLEVFTFILNLINTKGAITQENLSSINDTLKYTDDQLQLLVQSVLHIYKKACMIITKPATLQKDLENKLKLDATKAEAFIKVWTEVTKDEFGDLDKRKKLDDVTWSLHLKTHSSNNTAGNQIEPVAHLHLDLSDFDNTNNERSTLEMSGGDLEQLYKTLEGIQVKLDAANNVK